MITNLFQQKSAVILTIANNLANTGKLPDLDSASILAARNLAGTVPQDFTNLETYNKWRLALAIVEKVDGVSYPLYITSPTKLLLAISTLAAGAIALVAFTLSNIFMTHNSG